MQTQRARLKLPSLTRLNRPGKFALAVLVACLIALAIDYVSYDALNPLAAMSANHGLNGLWLRYFWYAGKYDKKPEEWSAMVRRLREHQIKYAYFHVLTTNADGTLRSRKLENARKITATVHAQAPGVMPIAWLYVGSAAGGGAVDLTKSETRKNLINELLWLMNDCAFDGVQIDYEFCACGDRGFLELMKEMRAAMPSGKLLSVATPMWYPGTLYGWDDTYFSQVAGNADQIAVMCYDSYLYLPRLYVQLVAAQVAHVSNAVVQSGNGECKVVFGLPTYEDVTLAHHRGSESLANALRGIDKGLHDAATKHATIDGIALFADYTTDEGEWSLYDRFWLGKHQ